MSDYDWPRAEGAAVPERFTGDWFRRIGRMLVLAVQDFLSDSGPQWAAAIAYYALLSLFPLLLAAASIASLFIDPEWAVQRITEQLGDLLPTGEQQIEEIVTGAIEAGAGVGIVSVAGLLWTGSRVFSALTKALNVAYDVDEKYGFVRRTAIEFAMVATLGLLFVMALASRYVFSFVLGFLDLVPADGAWLYEVAAVAVPALLLAVALFLAYRLVPRRRPDTSAALLGAVTATVAILVARPIFLGYVQEFGEYNLIYGSLAIMVILVFWAWIVAVIILLGGELVSHYQMMMINGLSAEEVKKRHERRSLNPKQHPDAEAGVDEKAEEPADRAG